MTLLDFQISGARLTGAEPCLNHLYAELKAFAARTGLYVHMTGLTRGLLSWESSAAFPTGNLSNHEHHVCSFCCYNVAMGASQGHGYY